MISKIFQKIKIIEKFVSLNLQLSKIKNEKNHLETELQSFGRRQNTEIKNRKEINEEIDRFKTKSHIIDKFILQPTSSFV